MPLVNAKEMLTKAKAGHYAVGQFNINNLEWTKSILLTAQELNSPVILGVSEGAGKYMCGYKTVVGMVNGMLEELNRHDFGDDLLYFLGRIIGLFRQLADLLRHNGKSSSRFSCPCRFNAGIQRKQVRFVRYGLNHGDRRVNALDRFIHDHDLVCNSGN